MLTSLCYLDVDRCPWAVGGGGLPILGQDEGDRRVIERTFADTVQPVGFVGMCADRGWADASGQKAVSEFNSVPVDWMRANGAEKQDGQCETCC